MSASKIVTLVHSDSQVRIHLRTLLQDRGWTVLTDHCCRDLLADRTAATPAVILLDRSMLGEAGLDILSGLRERWPDTQIVYLPEDEGPASLAQLVPHLDRLVSMKTSRDLLQVLP